VKLIGGNLDEKECGVLYYVLAYLIIHAILFKVECCCVYPVDYKKVPLIHCFYLNLF